MNAPLRVPTKIRTLLMWILSLGRPILWLVVRLFEFGDDELCIFGMASITRLAFTGSGSLNSVPRTVGDS